MTAGEEAVVVRVEVEGPLDRLGAERLLLDLRRAVRALGLGVRARVERGVEACDASSDSSR